MANRKKYGTNFAARATVGSQNVVTTQNIGFAKLSKDDVSSLREKLMSDTANTSADNNNFELDKTVLGIIPNKEYKLQKLERAKLKPAPDEWNFFAKADKNKLIMLAESIYQNGLLQPIIVRSMAPDDSIYQILAGHTRNEAYKILYDVLEDPKYLYIDALVFPYKSIEDYQAQDIICDTNFMQRGNLPARDMAKCVFLKAKRLQENHIYGQGSISERIAEEYKIKRTSVFMWKKLANITDELQKVIDARKITLKNAYKLASLSHEDQDVLIELCSNYLSNESLRDVKPNDSLDTIVNKVEKDFGVSSRSLRYEIPETRLKNPKDEPILVFADSKLKDKIIEEIKKISGAYVID